jgi:NitT/TauT family transport system substrate-binding protein
MSIRNRQSHATRTLREEHMILRNLSATLGALCLLATGASAANVKVNIGYATAADYLPAFVSKENGCFAANGIDAQFTRITVTAHIPAALIADTMQIGALTATAFLPAVENGIELVAVAGGTRILQGNETISLVTSTKFQVKRGADLVGKKIGVPGVNSVADVMFRKWLKNEGVDVAKVQIIEAPFPQMKDLIKSGQIDGALVVEPIRSMIANEGVGQRAGVEYHTAVAKDSILAFWTASKKWADKNPQAVASFRKCLTEGIAWVGANPDRAREIEKQYLGFNTPVRPDWNVEINDEDFKLYVDVSLELGVLRKRVDAKNLVWAQR